MKDEPRKQDEQADEPTAASDEAAAASDEDGARADRLKAMLAKASAERAEAGDGDDGDDLIGGEGGVPSLDDVDVKDLLRAALKPPPARTSVIRRGVQERIRNESRGRFFADGWSRNSAPKATFLVTTLLMLLLTLLAWAFLSPVGVEVFTG